jgi:hypothetical protein
MRGVEEDRRGSRLRGGGESPQGSAAAEGARFHFSGDPTLEPLIIVLPDLKLGRRVFGKCASALAGITPLVASVSLQVGAGLIGLLGDGPVFIWGDPSTPARKESSYNFLVHAVFMGTVPSDQKRSGLTGRLARGEGISGILMTKGTDSKELNLVGLFPAWTRSFFFPSVIHGSKSMTLE